MLVVFVFEAHLIGVPLLRECLEKDLIFYGFQAPESPESIVVVSLSAVALN